MNDLMNESIPDLLAISAEEVLETMFFTQVVGIQPDVAAAKQAPEDDCLAVRLCFLGSAEGAGHGGYLDLEVSLEGAQWIASSFLAAEEGAVETSKVADVICELTNVVCGNIVSNIASEAGFTMLSPKVLSPESDPGSSSEWLHAACYERSFQLERGWLTLRLKLASAP
jgi:CheY-specific phosphatase CheX